MFLKLNKILPEGHGRRGARLIGALYG